MAKSLKDILAGVKSSKVRPGSTGSHPGVDYDPKAPAEQDFVAKHKTEVHADRVGNGDDVYKGKTKEAKYNKQDPKVYEEVEASDDEEDEPVAEAAECSHTEAGKDCPVHGESACPDYDEKKGKKLRLLLGGKKGCDCKEEVELDEISKKVLTSYKKKNLAGRDELDREYHRADNLAKEVGKLRNKGLASDDAALATSDYAHHLRKKTEKRDKYLFKAQDKIEAKTKKKTNEEVEVISEIGDTAKGREALKKYVEKNVAGTKELNKKAKEAKKEAQAAGREANRHRSWAKTGHTTAEKLKSAEEHEEKTGKHKEHLRKKVVHRDEGITKAQNRIASKGKNVKKVLSSKTFVDTQGERVRSTRRPGLEDKTHGETMHIKPKEGRSSKRFRMHIPDSATKPQEKKTGIKFRMKVATEEVMNERHMTSAEKRKEAMIKKKTDPSEMKASMMKQYGTEKGKNVYFATIRKKAMSESLAFPMLEGGKKKKQTCKETTGPDTPIRYPSGNVGKDRDTGYAI